MKNMKLIKALDLADDKYVEEADPRKGLKRKRLITMMISAALTAALLAALAVWLFVPYRENDRVLSEHRESEFYSVIKALRRMEQPKSKYKNNYEKYIVSAVKGEEYFDVEYMRWVESGTADGGSNGEYVEVTDNQTAGVIEPDRLKRTDKYAFWIDDFYDLRVYTIQGEESKLISTYNIDGIGADKLFLSEDCQQVILVSKKGKIALLDVSDVNDIKETGRISISGEVTSSRLINGKVLLTLSCKVSEEPDYSNLESFIPYVEVNGEKVYVKADDIKIADLVQNGVYTAVCILDAETLELNDISAYLGYQNIVEYISGEHIYLVYSYIEETLTKDRSTIEKERFSEIQLISFAEGELTDKWHIKLKGTVGKRYWLDEYNGVLRVLANYRKTHHEREDGSYLYDPFGKSERDTFLYCIDVETMEVLGKASGFVPINETVEAVRFNGDQGYVCTARIWTMTDPVFFFDLSDPGNITYKDTGTIDGYSHSLVDFGDVLLGIGGGDTVDTLKIEVYKEAEDSVVSVDKYLQTDLQRELNMYRGRLYFSKNYSDYYIDKENGLVGMITNRKDKGNVYTVVRYKDGKLTEILEEEIPGYRYSYAEPLGLVKGFYSDGWFYLITGNDDDESEYDGMLVFEMALD